MAGVPVCRPQPTEIDGYYTSHNFMTHAYSDPLVLGQVLVILWQSKDTWKERFPFRYMGQQHGRHWEAGILGVEASGRNWATKHEARNKERNPSRLRPSSWGKRWSPVSWTVCTELSLRVWPIEWVLGGGNNMGSFLLLPQTCLFTYMDSLLGLCMAHYSVPSDPWPLSVLGGGGCPPWALSLQTLALDCLFLSLCALVIPINPWHYF